MFRYRPNKEWGRKSRKEEDRKRNLHGADRAAAIAEGLAEAGRPHGRLTHGEQVRAELEAGLAAAALIAPPAEKAPEVAAERYVVVVQRERDSWGEDGWTSYLELDDVIGPFDNYADAARRELAEMHTYTRTEVKKLIEP